MLVSLTVVSNLIPLEKSPSYNLILVPFLVTCVHMLIPTLSLLTLSQVVVVTFWVY
jgi:hypothetical protein